jgi:hypothetical protein
VSAVAGIMAFLFSHVRQQISVTIKQSTSCCIIFCDNHHAHVLRFSSLLLLILLGAFLVFSSLGAGSDKRTRTPLGAHQR